MRHWQRCEQKAQVHYFFGGFSFCPFYIKQSSLSHSENKSKQKRENVSSQAHISVRQINLPFVFGEGVMTSWQGNPNTKLLRRQPLLRALNQTKLGLSERGVYSLACSLWYIVQVHPDSSWIVYMLILGTGRRFVNVISCIPCYGVQFIAMWFKAAESQESSDAGNRKNCFVVCFRIYFLALWTSRHERALLQCEIHEQLQCWEVSHYGVLSSVLAHPD